MDMHPPGINWPIALERKNVMVFCLKKMFIGGDQFKETHCIFRLLVGDGEVSNERSDRTIRTGNSSIGRDCCSLILVAVLATLSFVWIRPCQADMRKMLTPRISIQQEYDDNIDLEPENEDSDWITLVSPGISLDLESPETRLNFDYEAGFSFYRDDSSNDTTRHQGRVSWDQELGRHLSFHLSDAFVRSEDPIVESEGVIEDIRRERGVEYRNTGEASLSYDFGAEDQVTAGYRNRYTDDRSSANADSLGHEGFVNLDMWFGPRYGIGVTSHYNRGKFEQGNDFDQYGAGLTVNYRWQPSRRVYVRYDFLDHDYEDPASASERNDYQVHEGNLGVSLGLGPHTEFNLEGGYFFQDYDAGDHTDGVSFSGSLITRARRTTLRLEGSGGYGEDYYSSEDLGSTQFRQVSGSADYLLTEDLRIFGSASYRWEEFFGEDALRDRTDKVWRTTAGLSFSFWRRLSLSLQGTHSERDSDDPSEEFEDNRVMLRLTAAYPFRL